MKLLIEIRAEDISPQLALRLVSKVIDEGKISGEARGVPQYCYLTKFHIGIVVQAKEKRTVDSADSFIVDWDREVPPGKDQAGLRGEVQGG